MTLPISLQNLKSSANTDSRYFSRYSLVICFLEHSIPRNCILLQRKELDKEKIVEKKYIVFSLKNASTSMLRVEEYTRPSNKKV